MPRAFAVSVVLFAVLIALSSLAHATGPAFTSTSSSPAPASVRFLSDGGAIGIDVSGEGNGAAGAGFLIEGPAGAVLVTMAKIPDRDGVVVDTRGTMDVHFDMTATTESYTGFGKGLVFQNAPAGEYALTAFGAGDVTRWTWRISDPGASILEERVGTGATWLATSRDFQGETNVQAFQSGAGARATDGTFRFAAKEGLLGVFYPVHATSVHDSLMATTPTGPRDCTCAWMGNGPVGAYTLHESGIGAGQALLADVVFIGADASFS